MGALYNLLMLTCSNAECLLCLFLPSLLWATIWCHTIFSNKGSRFYNSCEGSYENYHTWSLRWSSVTIIVAVAMALSHLAFYTFKLNYCISVGFSRLASRTSWIRVPTPVRPQQAYPSKLQDFVFVCLLLMLMHLQWLIKTQCSQTYKKPKRSLALLI